MTEIATSVMALSAITPAAMFSYLGIEKYKSKLNFSFTKSAFAFDLQIHRGALERHVERYFNAQLKEQVVLTVCGEQMRGFIRQSGRDTFTFFINYNSPVISVQRVFDGWLVISAERKYPKELVNHFIITLENKLFN